jgi:hypothetical protein
MLLANLGLDVVLSPKLFLTSNFNYFQFLDTASFSAITEKSIGVEFNSTLNYRLFLNENLILQLGGNIFFPFDGGKQVLGNSDPIFTANLNFVFLY